jgi:2'-5' RNA ligase
VRLFVALEIPVQVREGLAALISEFRGLAPKLKWVRPENLHLTLKFIG